MQKNVVFPWNLDVWDIFLPLFKIRAKAKRLQQIQNEISNYSQVWLCWISLKDLFWLSFLLRISSSFCYRYEYIGTDFHIKRRDRSFQTEHLEYEIPDMFLIFEVAYYRVNTSWKHRSTKFPFYQVRWKALWNSPTRTCVRFEFAKVNWRGMAFQRKRPYSVHFSRWDHVSSANRNFSEGAVVSGSGR